MTPTKTLTHRGAEANDQPSTDFAWLITDRSVKEEHKVRIKLGRGQRSGHWVTREVPSGLVPDTRG